MTPASLGISTAGDATTGALRFGATAGADCAMATPIVQPVNNLGITVNNLGIKGEKIIASEKAENAAKELRFVRLDSSFNCFGTLLSLRAFVGARVG
jgi:hypothetical protein